MWRGSFRAPNLAAGGRVLRNVLCDVAPPVADEPVEHMPYTVVEICLTSLTTMSSGSAASPYLLVPTAFSCFVFCFVTCLDSRMYCGLMLVFCHVIVLDFVLSGQVSLSNGDLLLYHAFKYPAPRGSAVTGAPLRWHRLATEAHITRPLQAHVSYWAEHQNFTRYGECSVDCWDLQHSAQVSICTHVRVLQLAATIRSIL
jgi:hypothetical protein